MNFVGMSNLLGTCIISCSHCVLVHVRGYVWTVHVNYARKYVEMDCGHFGTHVYLKYSESSCNIFMMTAFV